MISSHKSLLKLVIFLCLALFSIKNSGNYSLINPVQAVATANEGFVNGCFIYGANPDNSGGSFISGWEGNIYYYPWKTWNYFTNTGNGDFDLYVTDAYLNGGYANGNYYYGLSKTSVATLNTYVKTNVLSFSYDNPGHKEVWDYLDNFYDSGYNSVYVPVSNFAFFLNAYLVPSVSGTYTFDLGYVDDLAIVNLGDGISQIACCQSAQLSNPQAIPHTQSQIKSIWTPSGPSGVNQFTTYLTAGYMYPISLFYVNRNADGSLDFTYTDPQGTVHSDWSNLAYQVWSVSKCSAQSSSYFTTGWTGSTTSTNINTSGGEYLYSYWTNNNLVTVTYDTYDNLYTIYTPYSMSTISQFYPGITTTTTYSSSLTTLTTGGVTEMIVYVHVPYTTLSSTSFWLKSSTSWTVFTQSSSNIISELFTPYYLSTSVVYNSLISTATTFSTKYTTLNSYTSEAVYYVSSPYVTSKHIQYYYFNQFGYL
ncbi:hypothetical protein DAHU10_020030 [Hanseniaspora uvarum]|nr:hypothetical protein DAHU10_020030 [Hanseniaspora uvarum]